MRISARQSRGGARARTGAGSAKGSALAPRPRARAARARRRGRGMNARAGEIVVADDAKDDDDARILNARSKGN